MPSLACPFMAQRRRHPRLGWLQVMGASGKGEPEARAVPALPMSHGQQAALPLSPCSGIQCQPHAGQRAAEYRASQVGSGWPGASRGHEQSSAPRSAPEQLIIISKVFSFWPQRQVSLDQSPSSPCFEQGVNVGKEVALTSFISLFLILGWFGEMAPS